MPLCPLLRRSPCLDRSAGKRRPRLGASAGQTGQGRATGVGGGLRAADPVRRTAGEPAGRELTSSEWGRRFDRSLSERRHERGNILE
jgi:hypothetical protein